MKFFILGLLLTTSITSFGNEICNVSGQLASEKSTIIDRTTEGRANTTIALADAHLAEEAGAECAEVVNSGSLLTVKAYYKILSGKNEGKLMEINTIFKTL